MYDDFVKIEPYKAKDKTAIQEDFNKFLELFDTLPVEEIIRLADAFCYPGIKDMPRVACCDIESLSLSLSLFYRRFGNAPATFKKYLVAFLNKGANTINNYETDAANLLKFDKTGVGSRPIESWRAKALKGISKI